MSVRFSFDPARSAVLSLDFQNGIVSIYTKGDPALTERAASVLNHARTLTVRIIHVQVGFRPKMPEISMRNPLLRAFKNSPAHQRLFQGVAGAIHASVSPTEDDVVITKHRVSASQVRIWT